MPAFARPSLIMAMAHTTLYAVVSRLPMIFAMVYMVYELKLTGGTPVLVFCGYCAARLLAAVATVSFFGMPAMFLGTATGLVGYSLIWMDPTNVPLFSAMIVLTGFTETVTGIDALLKIECLVEDYSLAMQQLLFRLHLIGATLGSLVAYLGGGAIYDFGGVGAICALGVSVSALNLIVLGLYCFMRPVLCKSLLLKAESILRVIEAQEQAAQAARAPSPAPSPAPSSEVPPEPKADGLPAGQGPQTGALSARQFSAGGSSSSALMHMLGDGSSSGLVQMLRRPGSMMSRQGSMMSSRSALEMYVRSGSMMSSRSAGLCSELAVMDLLHGDRTPPQEKVAVTVRDLRTYAQMGKQERRKTLLALFAVVLSFYVTVLPISNNFGVLALFWQAQWGMGTTVSGLIMALGELGGLLLLQLLARREVFELGVLRPFGKPMNLVLATLAAAAAAGMVAVPNMGVSAIGSVGVHVINVLLHSFCSECAADWAPHDIYATWIGRCYFSKRLSNATVAALAIELFFMEPLQPSRPYLFVSGIVALWSSFLLAMFYYLRLLPFQQASQGRLPFGDREDVKDASGREPDKPGEPKVPVDDEEHDDNCFSL